MATMEPEKKGLEPVDMDSVAHQRGQLKMVVCGNIQSGKSSLINSLLGTNAIEEHLSPGGDQLESCVGYGTQVEVREGGRRRVKAVDVLLWDTPGLGTGEGTEDGLKQVTEKISETDVLVYCLDMRTKLDQDAGAVDGIVQLTKALGEDIWKNAIFVLTYANAVNPPPQSTTEKDPYFQQSLAEWESAIKLTLRSKASVTEEIITDAAIVPIGYRKQPPPDRKDWLTPFWRDVFRKMKENSLLDGMDVYNLTIGPAGINWVHVVVGVVAGTALGAVSGGLGLGVAGALIGGGVGGVGTGTTIALVERLPFGKLLSRMKE